MTKMQPEMTEGMKIKYFRSLLRETHCKHFLTSIQQIDTLEDILAVFRRKYVKPESQATAKHK